MNKWFFVVPVCLALTPCTVQAQTVRSNAGFTANKIPANDDGSSPLVNLGFTINFFGQIRNSGYVNNNGNITFDSALASFTPFGLDGTRREIIAAFFGDVDTRARGSNLVTYGNDTINGRSAFGINYVNVGYFSTHDDKLNSFQLILIDRNDLGSGNFDLEFNYDKIKWETGEASGGVGGLGGVSAAVGWSNGTALPGTSFMLPGSLIPGSFLDNGPRSLVNRKQYTSSVGIPAGRYSFRARNGFLLPGLAIVGSSIIGPITSGEPFATPLIAVGGTTYRWTMQTDPGQTIPWLNLSAAGILSGTPPTPGAYDLTATVTSKVEDAELTDVQRVTITVVPPTLSISERSCPLAVATAGVPYTARLAATGGAAPYVWTWGDTTIPGLTLTEAGVISGTPARAGNYAFNLRVASSRAGAAEPGSRQCSLTVQAAFPEPTIASCPATAGTLGVPISEPLRAGGGNGPYQWSVSGTLPTGLAVTSTGSLSGIAETQGAFNFILAIVDQNGKSSTKNCSMTIAKSVINIATACPLAGGITGTSYSQKLSINGGVAPYTWSTLGNFPRGLIISADGSIDGRPNDGGAYQFRLQAEDAGGNKASVPCSLIVQRAVLSINSCPLPPGNFSAAYRQPLSVVGGMEPLIWTSTGRLPSGLFVSSQGLLSGVPSEAGDFIFQVGVKDGNGLTAAQECQLAIEPSPLQLTTGCPANTPAIGSSFTFQPVVSGGIAPYRWSMNGTPPPGLRMNLNGSISGSATQLGAFTFETVVRDSRSRETSATCTVATKLPGLPQISVTGPSGPVAPATSQLPFALDLAEAYPLPVEVVVGLKTTAETGTANGDANQSDPSIRFAGGQPTQSLTIPAGIKRMVIPVMSSGTVASQTSVAVTKLRVAGSDLPLLPPAGIFYVRQLAPVLTDACYRTAAPGLQLELTGYSTSRDLSSASLTLNGTKLPNIALTGFAGDYFLSPLSIRTGGSFSIAAPVTIVDSFKVDTLTVQITNRSGVSASRAVRACQ